MEQSPIKNYTQEEFLVEKYHTDSIERCYESNSYELYSSKQFLHHLYQSANNPQKIQSNVIRVKKIQQTDETIRRNNTSFINFKRQQKAGRFKKLIEVNQQKSNVPAQKVRHHDTLMPINVKKLSSPLLVQLIHKRTNVREGNESKKTKIVRYTSDYHRLPDNLSQKRKAQRSLKELYEREYMKHRIFYQIPLTQSLLQQAAFLNIQSIKIPNPQQNNKRKSVIQISKKVQQKIDFIDLKEKRNSADPTLLNFINNRSQRIRTKTCSPLKLVSKDRPFKPPFEKYFYRDFIWKIGYSHNFQIQVPIEQSKSFRVFIGNGNNKLLVKSLMKQRSWWTIVDKYDESCHFVWTQIKIPDIFRNQKKQQTRFNLQRCCEQKVKKNINQKRILSYELQQKWDAYFKQKRHAQTKLNQQMTSRNKYFSHLQKIVSQQLQVHNHLQNNYIIGNKKALFKTMSLYYELCKKNVFQYLPITFHISEGIQDPQYSKFLAVFYQKAKQIKKIKSQESEQKPAIKPMTNTWIVKPGQFTNRGYGIKVCLSLDEVRGIIKTKQKHPNGNPKTYIVQTYLDRPLLYNKRKFDIRHYMMISSLNGVLRGYWYQEGYLRTTSFEYNLGTCLSGIHLTNDAIQKYLPEYGKYQKGNKLSYQDFQSYLLRQESKFSFFRDAYPRMKEIAIDAMRASYLFIDKEKRLHNFEIFGMDFMIDENFHPWLIEINTNPCLQLSCPLLGRLIPEMLQNAFIIGLDPLFNPPVITNNKGRTFKENFSELNRFDLVFDSSVEGQDIEKLYQGIELKQQIQSEDDEIYQDDGKQLEE